MKVAVVGAGISGLAAAHALRNECRVTLFESASCFGGHAHTVDVTLPDADGRLLKHGVDTGFLVYNERTYPRLIKLFAELGVITVPSDMSFSVQVPRPGRAPLEWSGTSLSTVFAQRGNLLRPAFWSMLRDLMRFNKLATRLAKTNEDGALSQPLGEFLDSHGFGAPFRDWYLLPMLGCIWSCPTDQMLRFPTATLVRFCHNHGLLQVVDRPRWFTVAGGSRRYVDKIVAGLADARVATPVLRIDRDAAGVTVSTPTGTERFDKVVMATHSDTALSLLAEPSRAEAAMLGAIRYQANRAVLHTDVSVLPRQRAAWSAWNYEAAPPATEGAQSPRVCLHYLLNQLQPLPWTQPVIVSLNPLADIDPSKVLARRHWEHPVFDAIAVRAQAGLPGLQGRQHSYFCGAWAGYGFHEDGLAAGQAAARRLLEDAAEEPLKAAA